MNGGKKTYAPDWRPVKRVKNKRAVKEDPRCRVCGKTGSLSKHHLVPKGQGGDDVPSNLVMLCGHGTVGCHGLIEARDKKTCAALRVSLSPDELGYIISKKNAAWLERRYALEREYPK